MRTLGKLARAVLLGLLVAVPSALPQAGGGAGFVNFSFDEVDIRTFVRLVGETTGLTLVVDANVEGKVSVVTPSLPASQVYPLFVAVLESAGCSVVKDGAVYRVVRLAAREGSPAPVVGPDEPLPPEGLVTRVLRLQYVRAADVRKVLEARVAGGKAGNVAALEATNHLIVTDTAANLRRIERIVAEVDRPGLSRVTEVVPLQYVAADELAQQLTLATSEGLSAAEQLARRLPQVGEGSGDAPKELLVVPAPHSNRLILVGTPAGVMAGKALIAQMDIEPRPGRGRLQPIFLDYIGAEETAKNITALIEKTAEKKSEGAARRIAIEPSAGSNALLVDATPQDFELVRDLVRQLDQAPQQVLLEVLIVEVSLSDNLDIGVELASLGQPSRVGDTVVQGASTLSDSSALLSAIQSGLFPNGLTFALAHGTYTASDGTIQTGYPLLANINAQRQKGKLKILSNIPLLAQNNKEASVSVVDNIPLLRSTIEGGSGTARDVIQNIDRMDVGIKLKLTPHINPKREVCLVLSPSIEALVTSTASDATSRLTPTIAKREVSTTVTMADGNTIVISGLIRENQRQAIRRVPILGSIPVLGWVFRRTVNQRERTNLLIFVTPHLIADDVSAQRIRRDWEAATGLSTTNMPGPIPPGE